MRTVLTIAAPLSLTSLGTVLSRARNEVILVWISITPAAVAEAPAPNSLSPFPPAIRPGAAKSNPALAFSKSPDSSAKPFMLEISTFDNCSMPEAKTLMPAPAIRAPTPTRIAPVPNKINPAPATAISMANLAIIAVVASNILSIIIPFGPTIASIPRPAPRTEKLNPRINIPPASTTNAAPTTSIAGARTATGTMAAAKASNTPTASILTVDRAARPIPRTIDAAPIAAIPIPNRSKAAPRANIEGITGVRAKAANPKTPSVPAIASKAIPRAGRDMAPSIRNTTAKPRRDAVIIPSAIAPTIPPVIAFIAITRIVNAPPIAVRPRIISSHVKAPIIPIA